MPIPMTTRQKIKRPDEVMDGLADTKAQQKVLRTMMPSTTPYILRRP